MLIAEGDKVAFYVVYSGPLTGPMVDFPTSGKSAELNFITIFRIEEGRIAEIWAEWDNITMLTQLGLFPPPPSPQVDLIHIINHLRKEERKWQMNSILIGFITKVLLSTAGNQDFIFIMMERM